VHYVRPDPVRISEELEEPKPEKAADAFGVNVEELFVLLWPETIDSEERCQVHHSNLCYQSLSIFVRMPPTS
jgi:hypothetical protein